MQTTLKNATELGSLIRLARKAQNIRQDDAAGSIGVSAAAKACSGASCFRCWMAWVFD